jgi:DNA polymerase III epsilon subunit-like protein
MSEIKTLVYFDIEATGLKNSGRPRICEISLVAVNIQDVLNSKTEDAQYCEAKFLPRIVNKLTLCIYPKAVIPPLVSDLTGLDNYNLSEQSSFNKNIGELIKTFLSSLPAPVCLVAHNGNVYDFPLLKAELDKVEIQLSGEILCADSYIGIKKNFNKKSETRNKLEEENSIAATVLMKSGMLESELKEGHIVTPDKNHLTPRNKKRCLSPSKPTKSSKTINVDNSKVRKRLYFPNFRTPASFSLVNLHTHIFGVSPVQSHGAEADCLALLRITSALGSDWINWVKINCYPFLSNQKMWSIKDAGKSVI